MLLRPKGPQHDDPSANSLTPGYQQPDRSAQQQRGVPKRLSPKYGIYLVSKYATTTRRVWRGYI